MAEEYLKYSVKDAQDFQEELEQRLLSSPKYLGDEIELTLGRPDTQVILYSQSHTDTRIDTDLNILLTLRNNVHVTVTSQREITFENSSLNIHQLKFVEELVNLLTEFKENHTEMISVTE